MLEERIAELTTAVNALIAVMQGQGPDPVTEPAKKEKAPLKAVKAKAEKPEPAKEKPAPVASIEDVRAALVALSKAKGKDAAKQLLADFDAAKVGDLKQSEYGQVIEVAAKYEEAA